ncbi:MAG: phosphotransferase [Candidatus Saccharimonadales bacterium]
MAEALLEYNPDTNIEPLREILTAGTVADKIELAENLEPIEVHRDGPRFYGAHVTDGEQDFFIKDIVEPESPENAGYIHTAANHLRTEIDMLGYLAGHGLDIAPKLLAANRGANPWYATEHIDDGYLGNNVSPFFYERGMLRQTNPRAIFQNIQVIQGLTNQQDIPAWLTSPERAQTNNPDLGDSGIQFFADGTGWSRGKVERAYTKSLQIRAQSPQVLIHGEVYPQHVYVSADGEKTTFIDWENTKLGDAYSDHVAVWLRTLEEPEWQKAYFELVSGQEGFDQATWDASVFLSAMGNYRWLTDGGDQMEASRRQAAAEFCRQAAMAAADRLLSTQSIEAVLV